MEFPADYHAILSDAFHLVANTEYPSGVDVGYAASLADFDTDVQFRLLYEFLVACHVREHISKTLGYEGSNHHCKITAAHWKGLQSYAVVEFATEADAMLYSWPPDNFHRINLRKSLKSIAG